MRPVPFPQIADFNWLTSAVEATYPFLEFKSVFFDFTRQFGVRGTIYDLTGNRRRFAYRTDVRDDGYSENHRKAVIDEACADFAAWLKRIFL